MRTSQHDIELYFGYPMTNLNEGFGKTLTKIFSYLHLSEGQHGIVSVDVSGIPFEDVIAEFKPLDAPVLSEVIGGKQHVLPALIIANEAGQTDEGMGTVR